MGRTSSSTPARTGTKRLMQELAKVDEFQEARNQLHSHSQSSKAFRSQPQSFRSGKNKDRKRSSGSQYDSDRIKYGYGEDEARVGYGRESGGNGDDGIDHEFDPIESMGVVADNLMHWEVVLAGVDGTAYEDGRWKLDIRVPEGYPNEPPKITFVTPVCHPNVDFKTGEICLDLLKTAWSPVYTLSKTVLAIHQLLSMPAPDSPLNVDIANLMRDGDYLAANGLIRYYTKLYRYSG